MAFDTYTLNTWSIIVTWTLPNGSPKNITGGSVEAFAGKAGDVIEVDATIIDAAAGQVRASIPAATLTRGLWSVQIRVTVAGITRTYRAELSVRQSLEAAA